MKGNWMGYRKIIVDGKEYRYLVGSTCTNVIGVGPIWNHELKGTSAHAFEANRRVGAREGSVTPADVAEFIRRARKEPTRASYGKCVGAADDVECFLSAQPGDIYCSGCRDAADRLSRIG